MPNNSWSDRLASGFAIVRSAVLILFSLGLVAAPERTMPGSSSGSARTLALVFASRTMLLGIAFLVLAVGRKRQGLGWVFLADAALQVFDAGLAIVGGKGFVVVLPIAIGVLDAWAGRHLLRSARR